MGSDDDRRQSIGGTDMAAIMGVDPYRTVRDVYFEKVGVAPLRAVTGPMKRGLALEGYAAEMYAEQSGRAISAPIGIARHVEHSFLAGHLDRDIRPLVPYDQPTVPVERRGVGVLEVKCPNVYGYDMAIRTGLPEPWYVQGQHYLSITGLRWVAFAVFSAERWSLLVLELDRDQDLIDIMTERALAFWKRVQDHDAPEDEAVPVELPGRKGGVVVRLTTDRWADAVRAYALAKAGADLAKGAKDEARALLVAAMGEHEAVEGCGARVYHRQQNNPKRLDETALAAAIHEREVRLHEFIEMHFGPDLLPQWAAWQRACPVPTVAEYKRSTGSHQSLRFFPLDKEDA